jgi:hypothetical protein
MCDQVEMLVNQDCVRECPLAPRHIGLIAASVDRLFQSPSDQGVCRCLVDPQEAGQETTYVSDERRRALADMGFRRFKLDGRGIDPMGIARHLLLETLDGGEAIMLLDEMRRIMVPIAQASRTSLGPRERVAIPNTTPRSQA